MKVLVVFGSERGGTAGLAQLVATQFEHHGFTSEVRDATVPGPVDADLVVIGGALYLNRWHHDARKFVRSHRRELLDRPVWLFSSGPLDDTARSGDLAAVPQVRGLAATIEAHGHMTFGGRLDADAKGLVARSMAKKYAGDWRDPEHVAEWVRQIVHDFTPVEIVLPAQRVATVDVRIPAQRATKAKAPAATT